MPEVDTRCRFRKCLRLLNPGTPRHPRLRVGLLHSWPHLIPRHAVLADSFRNPFDQPESLGSEVSSSTVATSTTRLCRPRAFGPPVAICDAGNANSPPSPLSRRGLAHLNLTIFGCCPLIQDIVVDSFSLPVRQGPF